MSEIYSGDELGRFLNSQHLSHYGVMGMKWGVRNDETLRKYNGGGRREVGNDVERGQISRVKRREKILARFRNRRSGGKQSSVSSGPVQENASGKPIQQPVQPVEKPVGSTPSNAKVAKTSFTTDNAQQPNSGEVTKIASKPKQTDPSRMTLEELQSANARMQAEISYRQNQSKLHEMTMSKKERLIRDVKAKAIAAGKAEIEKVVSKSVSSAINSLGTSIANNPKIAAKAAKQVDKNVPKSVKKVVKASKEKGKKAYSEYKDARSGKPTTDDSSSEKKKNKKKSQDVTYRSTSYVTAQGKTIIDRMSIQNTPLTQSISYKYPS